MKTFLTKTLSILFTFVIGILFFVLIVHLTVRYASDFSIPKEKKYIIFGHSHPECAFNDDILIDHKNLSKSGETYFYTYQKVKQVLSNNNVNAIFIEYTNRLITKTMDDWTWGYERMNGFFPWHSPFMEKDDMWLLYKNNQQDFPKVISTSTRNNLTRILSLDFTIGQRYGGYTKLKLNKVAELIKNRNSVIKDTLNEREISINSLNYLEKIIDYCSINNVKVYLIRSPQHKYYQRENEQELLNLKNERFESIDFLDFDKFPLDDNEFGDFGHLNYRGAEVFSLWFNELIKNDLLSRNDKSAFINKEIEKVRAHNSQDKKSGRK